MIKKILRISLFLLLAFAALPVFANGQKEEATETKEVSVEVDKTETIKLEPEVPAVQDDPKTAVEMTPVETIVETVTESVKMEVKEEVETLKVEGMPEEMVQPQIATH